MQICTFVQPTTSTVPFGTSDAMIVKPLYAEANHAASRVILQLAWRFNMYMVDIELMSAKYWNVADYLLDNHHLNQEANLQVLNVYLNLMRNRDASKQETGWACVAAKSWQVPQSSHARAAERGSHKGQG